ncbi:Transposase [Lactobacillus helveticus CIRM-BIA 951]|uniref:Transposase n=1 Tax=Lactobacillus helveticus CIRM-BIA 951 TaxID=1226334 RepID=U6F7T7_LACHE|nr:Transposase [Lactobacillus helveticus CIRM-BIA 951]
MVKYSSELKAEVVSEYLQGDISISLLSKKRNLPRIQVGRWIQNFRLSGADALKRRRVKSLEDSLQSVWYRSLEASSERQKNQSET